GQPKEDSGPLVLLLRCRQTGGDQEAHDLENGDPVWFDEMLQALGQPVLGLLYLSFPQRQLRQIGIDPRQEELVFQLKTEAQALAQQPTRLRHIATIERNEA